MLKGLLEKASHSEYLSLLSSGGLSAANRGINGRFDPR